MNSRIKKNNKVIDGQIDIILGLNSRLKFEKYVLKSQVMKRKKIYYKIEEIVEGVEKQQIEELSRSCRY